MDQLKYLHCQLANRYTLTRLDPDWAANCGFPQKLDENPDFAQSDVCFFPVVFKFHGKILATWRLLFAGDAGADQSSLLVSAFPYHRVREIIEQAAGLAREKPALTLWTDARFQFLTVKDFKPFETFDSAGLAAFLVAFARLTQRPLRGIAATGVVARTLHAQYPAKVTRVVHLREKMELLVTEAPFLGIKKILYPAENASEIPSDFDARGLELIPVDDTLDAVRAVFGDVEVSGLTIEDMVMLLEAKRFMDPYDPQQQAMITQTGMEVLDRLRAKTGPQWRTDEVVTRTVVGHYYVHQGMITQARNMLKPAIKMAERMYAKRDPWLDDQRYARLLNANAVLETDLHRFKQAIGLCERAIRVTNRRGQGYVHAMGTLVQALTRYAADRHAMGYKDWRSTAGRAVRWGRKLLAVSKTPGRHKVYMANAFSVREAFEDARDLLDDLLANAQQGERNPKFVLLAMANLYFIQGQWPEWLKAFEDQFAGTLNPKSWPDAGLAMAKAIALFATGRHKDGEHLDTMLGQALQTSNDSSLAVLYALARLSFIRFLPPDSKARVFAESTGMLQDNLPGNSLLRRLIEQTQTDLDDLSMRAGVALVF